MLLFAACSKQDQALPMHEHSFGVSVDPSMKAELDDLSVKWQAGDAIAVIPKGQTTVYKFTTTGSGTTATFTGTCPDGADNTYYAFYPYMANKNPDYYINTGHSSFLATFPSVQTAAEGSFPTQNVGGTDFPIAFMAAECTDGATFNMKNQMALLKFQVATDDIQEVSFVGESESKYLGGGKFISCYPFITADSTAVFNQGGSGRTISINVVPPKGETSFTSGKNYFAAVNTTLGSISSYSWSAINSKITVVTRTASQYTAKTSSAAISPYRGKIYNIGTVGKEDTAKPLTINNFDINFATNSFYKSSSGNTVLSLPTTSSTTAQTIYPVISGATRAKCKINVGAADKADFLWDETNTSFFANPTKSGNRVGIQLIPLKYKAITQIVITLVKVEGDAASATINISESSGSSTTPFGTETVSLSEIENGETKTVTFDFDPQMMGNSYCINITTKTHIRNIHYTFK